MQSHQRYCQVVSCPCQVVGFRDKYHQNYKLHDTSHEADTTALTPEAWRCPRVYSYVSITEVIHTVCLCVCTSIHIYTYTCIHICTERERERVTERMLYADPTHSMFVDVYLAPEQFLAFSIGALPHIRVQAEEPEAGERPWRARPVSILGVPRSTCRNSPSGSYSSGFGAGGSD